MENHPPGMGVFSQTDALATGNSQEGSGCDWWAGSDTNLCRYRNTISIQSLHWIRAV